MLEKSIIRYLVEKDYFMACKLCRKAMVSLNHALRNDPRNNLLMKEKIRIYRLWDFADKRDQERYEKELKELKESRNKYGIC